MRLLVLVLLSALAPLGSVWAQAGQMPVSTLPEQARHWAQIQAFRNFNKGKVARAQAVADALKPLPFFEDFSSGSISPDSSKWVYNSGVYVSDRFTKLPPSKGVATFDGVNVAGQPYSTNPASNGPCDTLTSRPFLLSNLSAGQRQSLVLSYFLQAGHPDIIQFRPDTTDSLLVQFYSPRTNKWLTWQTYDGGQRDASFIFHSHTVPDTLALDGFRFRFLNFGRQNGVYDIWNLDYIFFDSDRADTDTAYADLALAGPLPGFFKRYRAVPVEHFNADPQAAISDTITGRVNNMSENLLVYTYRVEADSLTEDPLTPRGRSLLSAPLSSPPIDAYERRSINSQGVVLSSLNDGRPFGHSTRFLYRIALVNNPGFNRIVSNDEIADTATLIDYYAEDDRSGEIVQYVTGNLAGMVKKFYPLQPGTLTGVDIHFDPLSFSVNPVLTAQVYVYRKISGVDGATADDVAGATTASLLSNGGKVYHIKFTNPVPMTGAPYYIGYRQGISDDNRLFIQTDVNSGQGEVYVNFSNNKWERDTLLKGQPIMRPYYQCAICPVATKPLLTRLPLQMAPNPARPGGLVRVEGDYARLWLRAVDGRQIDLVPTPSGAFTTALLPGTTAPGLYMLEGTSRNGQPAQARVVVQ